MDIFDGMEGTDVYMDNIIIHGRYMAEHDQCLQEVRESLRAAMLKLNTEKFKLRQEKLHFLGH